MTDVITFLNAHEDFTFITFIFGPFILTFFAIFIRSLFVDGTYGQIDYFECKDVLLSELEQSELAKAVMNAYYTEDELSAIDCMTPEELEDYFDM